jgi:MYXO-CTERM domain-containing protein
LFVGGSLQMQTMGMVPGPVQHRLDLPGGADSIRLQIGAVTLFGGGGLGGGGTLSVAHKEGTEIRWNTGGGGLSGDFTQSAPVPTDGMGGPATVTINGPFAPGTHYLQLIGTDGLFILQNTTFTAIGGSNPPDAGPGGDPDAGPGGPDAGPGGNPDAGGNPGDGDDTGGCGCTVGGDDDGTPLGGLLLGLLGVGAVIALRRRR